MWRLAKTALALVKGAHFRYCRESGGVTITIIAGMFGIAVATGLLAILNMILATMPTDGMMFINPSVDLTVVFIALLILVGSGLLAGLIPAQTAINVKPIDALRTE